MINELIPNMVKLLGGKPVTAENIAPLKLQIRRDAIALEVLSRFLKA
jgi:hypothetical protein